MAVGFWEEIGFECAKIHGALTAVDVFYTQFQRAHNIKRSLFRPKDFDTRTRKRAVGPLAPCLQYFW